MNATILTPVLLALLLVSTTVLPTQAQQAHHDSASTRARPIFTVVEQPPEFSGGMNQLGTYLRKSLRDSEIVQKANVKGRVFVNFIVNEEGKIEDVHVLKGLSPELDRDVIRIIENMPAWIPGKQNGRAVACRYNLPVNVPE